MTKKKKRKPGPKSPRPMTKVSIRLYIDQIPISAADVREAIDFWKRRDKKLGDLFFHRGGLIFGE